MKWTRIVLGGIAAGIVVNLADFVMHGQIMAATYKAHPDVFTQTQASPLAFGAIAIAMALCVAVLFAKTRQSWGAGWRGGLTFGFFLGLAMFFVNFYFPLVIAGFPYYLGWCWGGISLIDSMVGGAVLGAIIQKS